MVKRVAQSEPKYILEFSLENVMSYFNRPDRKDSVYGKLLIDTMITKETVMALYEHYLQYCFPAFYMSLESFSRYLAKFGGFDRADPYLSTLFRGARLSVKKDYVDWFDFLFMVICMEPSTKAHEARARMIFRCYDKDCSGTIDRNELKMMAKDAKMSEARLDELKVWDRFKSDNTGAIKLFVDDYARWVRDKKPKELTQMCRSPRSIIETVTQAVNKQREKFNKLKNADNGDDRRSRGSCQACRAQNFQYCMHTVLIDSHGRCTEPIRTANKADG